MVRVRAVHSVAFNDKMPLFYETQTHTNTPASCTGDRSYWELTGTTEEDFNEREKKDKMDRYRRVYKAAWDTDEGQTVQL